MQYRVETKIVLLSSGHFEEEKKYMLEVQKSVVKRHPKIFVNWIVNPCHETSLIILKQLVSWFHLDILLFHLFMDCWISRYSWEILYPGQCLAMSTLEDQRVTVSVHICTSVSLSLSKRKDQYLTVPFDTWRPVSHCLSSHQDFVSVYT